ncbi:hypothetical protein J7E96_35725 [Streptomyces sp. ISL-96]|uniref:hypothetical protein n=1 Tax=Streptomyces sp. ISL-96 TaxID=2819191 RepID=UPI001BEC5324|nr:hypothetical protein [Streptomyces sp. ISL-96]MBT2493755.1 hypothetical protein [Streptomyces sp. ISL-96]
MQDGIAEDGQLAGQWLKEHFAGDPDPKIDITLMVGKSNPAVYREVLEILFGPEGVERAT